MVYSVDRNDRVGQIFRQLDLNGDGTLSASEIMKAFEKAGQKPTLADVYSAIDSVDTTGTRTICLEDFRRMSERMDRGEFYLDRGI